MSDKEGNRLSGSDRFLEYVLTFTQPFHWLTNQLAVTVFFFNGGDLVQFVRFEHYIQ